MYSCSTLLKTWTENNPNVNPFSNCRNIAALGGADIFWAEFMYRYDNREIYDTDRFVSAVERCFLINEYKYSTMLASLNLAYNPLNNYLVSKTGDEKKTLNLSKGKTGTETKSPDVTITTTPNLTTTETATPTLKTRETTTPNITQDSTFTPTTEDTTVETPRVKTKTTETPRVSTTTTTKPADYTEDLSKTTFDNTVTQKPVQTVTRIYDSTGKEVVTTDVPTGTNETTVEPIEGTNTTKLSHTGNDNTITKTTGTNEKITEYISGNTTTQTTQNGTETKRQTGTEQMQYNTIVSDTGTDTLSYVNRQDSGYMYRNPQDAVKDEREIAAFSLIDVILKDVEQATLISVY